MSNLTPEEVDTRLTETRNEFSEESDRLWEGLEDERINRVAGDEANINSITDVADNLAASEARLSKEVIDRAEGDIRNVTSLTELAEALSEYRIKTDLELNNERIAREQLGVDLNSRVDDFIATIDFKFVTVHQAINDYQTATNKTLTLFDERIKKYEEMLQNITMDSIQITMDNGEINMGAWTILSQAREWDLEILSKFKGFSEDTDKKIDDALKEIQDNLPVEQDIIDKAIEQISQAPVIKDLDEKLNGAITDIDNVQKDLIKEVTDRQNELIAHAQNVSNELQANQTELTNKLQAESDARIEALQRESAIRQQELLNEAAERSAEIDERIKDIEAGTGADLTEAYRRIDEVNEKADNYKADADRKILELNEKADGIHDEIATETTNRIAEIKKLNDGLSQEIQYRKAGDEASLTAIENYKTSNDQALANVREEVKANVTATEAVASKVNSIDARLTVNEGETKAAKELAASAVTKAETALTENTALASRLDSVDASIENINGELGNKADAGAFNQLKAQVETIDGKVTTAASDITALKTSVKNAEGNITSNTSAIAEMKTVQTTQGDKITQLTTDTVALKNTLEDVQEEMSKKVESTAFNELKSQVEKNGDDITSMASEVTSLKTGLETVQGDLNTKASADALNALDSKVTVIQGRVTANSTSITKLTGRVDTVEEGLTKKLDASVINAYSTTVETNKAIADGVASYNANLNIGGANFWSFINGGSPDYGSRTVEFVNDNLQHQKLTITGMTNRIFSNLWQSIKVTEHGPITTNEPASVSFYIKSPVSRIRVYAYVWGQGNNVANQLVEVPVDVWHRVVIENIQPRDIGPANPSTIYGGLLGVRLISSDNNMTDDQIIGTSFEIKDIQCQIGNKATAFEKPTGLLERSANASASAIQTIKASVENHEGRITSNSNAITALKNDVAQNTKDIQTKASSQAVTDLKSQVDTMGTTVSSNAQAVTQLKNDVSTIQGELKNVATSEALQALDSRVETAEGKITSQQSAITKLQGDLATTNVAVSKKADASALTALDNKVTDMDGKLTSQSTAITKLENNLSVSDRLARLQSKGNPLINDPTFKLRNVMSVYQPGASTTFTRRDITAGNPSGSTKEYVLTSTAALPGTGSGWYPISPLLQSAANKVFLVRMVARVPKGYKFTIAKNATGDNAIYEILGNSEGTGTFSEYYFWLQCGSAGSFSTWGHVRWLKADASVPNPTPQDPLNIILSSYEAWDVTAVDESIPLAWEEKINATATANSQLATRVTSVEGTVTSHSTQLTDLTNRVETNEKDIATKAESSALETLDSKVTTIGGKVDSNTGAITTLQNRVTQTEKDITSKADASAVTALTNQVVKNEGNIESNSNAITSLNNAVSTGVIATGINSVAGVQAGAPILEAEITLVNDVTATGGKVIRIGNNSGNDQLWCEGKNYIPVNDKRMYRLRARYRQVTGANTFYLGIGCKDVLGRYVNSAGAPSASLSGSNYLITHKPTVGQWVEQEFFIRGRHTGSAPFGAGTITDPRGFQPNAATFAPMFIANFSNAAGEVEIDYITIEVADEYALIDGNSKAVQTLTGRVETAEGKITANANATTQLSNRVTSVEGEVSKKADASALTALDTRVSKNEKDITAQASQVTNLKASLDGLTVGGTNLTSNSHFLTPNVYNAWSMTYGRGTWETSKAIFTTTTLSSVNRLEKYIAPSRLEANKDYTLTFWATVPRMPDFRNFVNATIVKTIYPTEFSDTVFQPYTVVFRVINPAAGTTLRAYMSNIAVGTTAVIDMEKLELGNVPTDWSPAISDTADASAVQSLDAKVTNIDGRVSSNTTAITTLTGRVTKVEGDVAKKLDASVINSYYTKVETDTAIAGGLTEYNAKLRIGAANQAFNTTDGRLWATGYAGAKIERVVTEDKLLLTSSVNFPIQFTITGGTNVLKTTPLVTIARSAELVVSFKAKNIGDEPIFFNFNGLNHPVTNVPGDLVYLKGVDRTLAPGQEKEFAVWGRMRPTFDWFQFQFQVPNLQYTEAKFLMSDVMVNEGNAAAAWTPPYQNTANDISANATAIQNTETKVSNLEGTVAAQGSSINSINVSVGDINNNLSKKADASAVTSLEARVTSTEGSITSLSNQTTTLGNRLTTAEGKITANTSTISTLNNKVTDIDGRVTAQATALTKVESTLAGQQVGGSNLQPGTQLATNWAAYNANASIAKVAGGFKTDLIRVTKANASPGGALPITSMRKITARKNIPIIMTFKVRGNTPPSYIYLMGSSSTGSNLPANSITYSSTMGNVDFVTCTATWTGASFTYQTGAYPLIANTSGAAGTWFEFAEVMVQEGNTPTAWSASYLDIPEVDLSEYAKASAVTQLDTKVTQLDGKVTAQATLLTQLQSTVGDHTSKLQVQGEVVDGLKASYVVKTDVDGLVAGYGLYNDGTNTAFGVNADYFYVGKGTGPEGGKKPFMVLTAPQTIGGVTYPAGTWIDVALIANATIGTAHIADASITNAKIKDLNAEKITSGFINADRIAAKSIGVDKMVVGFSENLWDNQYMSATGTGFRVEGNRHEFVTLNNPNFQGNGIKHWGRNLIGAVSARFPVHIGEQYVVEYVAKQEQGTAVHLTGVWVENADGATGTFAHQFAPARVVADLGDGWFRFKAVTTIADNQSGKPPAWGSLYFIIDQLETATNPTYWTFADAVIRRNTTGELIVNGSITADKLDVGDLSAVSAKIGLLRTADTGARTEIRDNLITVFDDRNIARVKIGVF